MLEREILVAHALRLEFYLKNVKEREEDLQCQWPHCACVCGSADFDVSCRATSGSVMFTEACGTAPVFFQRIPLNSTKFISSDLQCV